MTIIPARWTGYLILCLLTFPIFTLSAATNSWTGSAGDGSWRNSLNWSLNRAPSSDDVVRIALPGTYTINIDTNVSIDSLFFGATGTGNPYDTNIYPVGIIGRQTLRLSQLDFVCAGTAVVTPSAVVAVDSGELSANMLMNGELRWSQGRVISELTVSPTGWLNCLSAAPKQFFGVITNSGHTTWRSSGEFYLGGQFWNPGTFILATNCVLHDGEFHNSGTIVRPAFSGEGTLHLVDIQTFVNHGIIEAEVESSLTLKGGGWHFEAGTEIRGGGRVQFSDFAFVTGDIRVTGTFELADGFLFGTNRFFGPGRFDWRSGGFDGGSTTFDQGLELFLVGPNDKGSTSVITNLTTTTCQTAAGLYCWEFWNFGTFVLDADTYGLNLYNLGTILRRNPGKASIEITGSSSGRIVAEAGAIIEVSGTWYGLTDGTKIQGAGEVHLVDSFDINGDITVSGNLTLNAEVSGNHRFDGPGNFNLKSSYFSEGTTVFAEDLNLCVLEGQSLDSTRTITNFATASFQGPGEIVSGVIWNMGTIVLETNWGVYGAEFNNVGTIVTPANKGETMLRTDGSFHNFGTLLAETNAVLTLDGWTYIFHDGTRIAGKGIVRLMGGASGSANILLNGTLQVDGGGQFVGHYVFSGPGSFELKGGYLSGSGHGYGEGSSTFSPETRLVFGDGARLESHSLTNFGIAVLRSQTSPSFFNSALWNMGTFVLETNYLAIDPWNSTFYNLGTFLLPAGFGEARIESYQEDGFINRGRLVAEAGATLTLDGQQYRLEDGSEIDGDGRVRLAADRITVASNLVVSGTLEFAEGEISGDQTFEGTGHFEWFEGIFRDGTTTFGRDLQVVILGTTQTLMEWHSLTNLGTVMLTNSSFGPFSFSDSSFVNQGTFHCLGDGIYGNGTLVNDGTFIANARTHVTCEFQQKGTLVIDEGELLLEYAPPFSAESRLRFREPHGGYLWVANTFVPGGTVELEFREEYYPRPGENFGLLYYDQLIGGFDHFELPGEPYVDDNDVWKPVYEPTYFTLELSDDSDDPIIIKQPENQVTIPGAVATFSVTVNATVPILYQWKKDGSAISNGPFISGATNASLTISNVTASSAGAYTVHIIDAVGEVSSEPAYLALVDRVVTLPATEAGPHSATLNGLIAPGQTPVTAYFEFGSITNALTRISLGTVSAQTAVTAWLTNLSMAQTYYFRLVSSNSSAVWYGEIESFVTPQFSAIPGFSASAGSGASVHWGDYNRDGWPDLLLSSNPGGSQTPPMPRMFQNDQAGGFTKEPLYISSLFTNATISVFDSDNDNDIDLFASKLTDSYHGELFPNEHNRFWEWGFHVPMGEDGGCAGDFNNDGREDLANTFSPDEQFDIYYNLGGNQFSAASMTLTPIRNAAVDAGDFDSDGDLDLLASGALPEDASRGVSYIGRNVDGTFLAWNPGFEQLYDSAVAWGDYNNDGKLDLVISGNNNTNRVTRIYQNLGHGAFGEVEADLPGVSRGFVDWGDYNNDGWLDLLLVGESDTGAIARVYRNLGDGRFVDANAGLAPVFEGHAGWADYDNDGRLDIALKGEHFLRIYHNNERTTNQPPSAPSGLAAQRSVDSVTFSWNPSNDDTTPATALTYNLRIGTTPGGTDVLSPLADAGGHLYLPRFGNVGQRTNWTLKLPNAGNMQLYWSVQAVDNSFSGSAFAIEETPAIPPVITSPLQSLMVLAGTNVTLQITVAGTPPFTYEWRKNGAVIPGASTAALTVTNVSDASGGEYSVLVTNRFGSASSGPATLAVIYPPVIVKQPVSLTVGAGTNAALSVECSGTLPLLYQWVKNGTDLPGQTNSILTFPAVSSADGNTYWVRVSNFAKTIVSSTAVLTVIVPPAITSQPQSRIIGAGTNVTFSVTATGTAPLTYQWRKDGIPVGGATTSTLTINSAMQAYAGNYSVIISNFANTVTSALVTLTVIDPPVITSQPISLTVGAGTNATFSASCSGTEPIAYQWQKNGTNVVGGTNSSLVFDAVTSAHAGTYRLVASNFARTVTSSGAVLTVIDPPEITAQPQSRTLAAGSNALFTVSAIGTLPLTYEWQKDGVPILNATNATLLLENVAMDATGNYRVVITNAANSVTSLVATLLVTDPPVITSQPQSQTKAEGTNVVFTVSASGAEPLAYQWHLGNEAIPGATLSSFWIERVARTNAGIYSVTVSNQFGNERSSNAVLTVIGDWSRPVLAIVSPKANAITNVSNIRLDGTCKDDKGVVSVGVRLNNRAVQQATLTGPSTNATWSVGLSLAPGTNEVVVVASDLAGNTATASRKFFRLLISPLTINVSGPGFTVPTTNAFGATTNGAPLQVGRSYRITAVAGTNYVFTNWSGSISSSTNVLNFIMQENMVLTANFITNPFNRVAGIYNGLFFEATGVEQHSAGHFAVNVSSKSGYSAKLMIDGDSMTFSGKFTLAGTSSRIVPRAKYGKPDLLLSLDLEFGSYSDQLTGAFQSPSWTANLLADRVTKDTNYTTQFAGKYTMIVPGLGDPTLGPPGYTYGSVTVGTNGRVTFNGRLADGSPAGHSIPFSKYGVWPFFVRAYPLKESQTNTTTHAVRTNVTSFKGLMMGWLSLTNMTPSTNKAPAGRLSWIKTTIPATNAFYPNGFTNDAYVQGSYYLPPALGMRALDVTNGFLVMAEGNLRTPFTNSIFLRTNNLITFTGFNTNATKPSLTASSGLLGGTFLHPDRTNARTPFYGVILQNQNFGAGQFVGSNAAGVLLLKK